VGRRSEGTQGGVAELMPVGEDYRARVKGGSCVVTIGQRGGGYVHGMECRAPSRSEKIRGVI
jgi:hypothetical protein